MKWFEWLRARWYAGMRRIDVMILWPSCKKQARDLDHARAAFALHAFADEAWISLGDQGVLQAIKALE